MQLYLPAQIFVGEGVLRKEAERILDLGSRLLLVTARSSVDAAAHALMETLRDFGAHVVRHAVPEGEPTVDSVNACAFFGRQEGVRAVIGLGGGSALDTAKAACAMITNHGSVEDYLEGNKDMRPLDVEPLPFIAIPTTAGTGSEATKNAVIMSREKAFKRSIRADSLMARMIFIDPALMVSLPEGVTAHAGLDAFTQCLESYISVKGNSYTRALAGEGLRLAWNALPRVYDEPGNVEARTDMALAALYSGMALGNGGLGAVHGLAAPIGAQTGLPHGLICAILLPYVLRVNMDKAQLAYAQAARRMLDATRGGDAQDAQALLDSVGQLCEKLRVPANFEGMIERAQIKAIVANISSSMAGNPAQFDSNFWEAFLAGLI